MTNVTIGMMWGWHTLTPGEPFTQAQVVKPAEGRFHPDRRLTHRRADFDIVARKAAWLTRAESLTSESPQMTQRNVKGFVAM